MAYCQIRPIFPVAKPVHFSGFWVILSPKGGPFLAQKILKIEQKFFKACPGHPNELELGFLGCAGGHGAFRDILLSASRRLNHLIMGAGTP